MGNENTPYIKTRTGMPHSKKKEKAEKEKKDGTDATQRRRLAAHGRKKPQYWAILSPADNLK